MTGNERALFEQLEPRVLMSATPAPESGAVVAVETDATKQEKTQQLVSEIAFVDTSVENYQDLIEGLERNVEIVLIGADENGLEKITSTLEGREDISAIHIISHGRSGEISLGNINLISTEIDDYKSDLMLWGQSLSADADILIYGCNVGQNTDFLNVLAEYTSADVAASDDKTGFSGDDQLEVRIGDVTVSEIIVQQTYEKSEITLAVNAAPVFVANIDFTSITEDDDSQIIAVADLIEATDADGDPEGIAVQNVDVENGIWQYRKTSSSAWKKLNNLDGGKARHLDAGAELRFLPDAENGGTSSFTFYAWDGTSYRNGVNKKLPDIKGGATAYSTASGTVSITTTDVNDAPVLKSTVDFNTTDEETISGDKKVKALIKAADVDDSSVEAMAITAFTAVDGVWQYKKSGSWIDISDVSETQALHLSGSSRLRFNPNGDTGGMSSITYYAWDTTNGVSNGVKADISGAKGGVTAYSSASDSSFITVTGINDAPEVTAPAIVNVSEDTPKVITGIQLSDVDAVSDVKLTLSVPSGSIAFSDSAASGVTAGQINVVDGQTIEITASLSELQNTLDGGGFVFTPAPDFNGSLTLSVTLNDLGSSGSGGAQEDSKDIAVQVASVVDIPTLTVNSLKVLQGTAPLPLEINANAGAEDEQLTVIVSGLPSELTLSAGLKIGNSWRLTAAQLTNLKIIFPSTFHGSVTATVAAQSTAGSQIAVVSTALLIEISPAVSNSPNTPATVPLVPTTSVEQLRVDVQELFRQSALQLVAGNSSLNFDQLALSERALEVIVSIFNDNRIVSTEVADPSGHGDGVESMDVYDLSELSEVEQQFIKEILLGTEPIEKEVADEDEDLELSFLTDEVALNELSQVDEKSPALTQADLDRRLSLEDTLLGDFDCLSI